ncbi:metalloprotease [bacterium]|nr:metalloprotease [bacterium]
MKYKGRERSSRVEDRRSGGGGRMVRGGGLVGLVVLLLYGVFSGNFGPLLQNLLSGGAQSLTQSTESAPVSSAAEEELVEFCEVVLRDTEVVWERIFREQLGARYEPPTLVLFRDRVESACGLASAATGPFYCPADRKLYLDLSFFEELKSRFGAPGDFAMAYVIAHEVAHHVQNNLGTLEKVNTLRARASETQSNALSVRTELQADFYSGVWAHYAERLLGTLEDGDLKEALNAAQAIGDDRLQKQAQGYVVPESFTHGTSAQRMEWFARGYKTGDVRQGDTFAELGS